MSVTPKLGADMTWPGGMPVGDATSQLTYQVFATQGELGEAEAVGLAVGEPLGVGDGEGVAVGAALGVGVAEQYGVIKIRRLIVTQNVVCVPQLGITMRSCGRMAVIATGSLQRPVRSLRAHELPELSLNRAVRVGLEHVDCERVVEPILGLIAVDGIGLDARAARVEGKDVHVVDEIRRTLCRKLYLHLTGGQTRRRVCPIGRHLAAA